MNVAKPFITKKLDLASPWVNYFRELEKLFECDDEVRVEPAEDESAINIYVSNTDKAEALDSLLPSEKIFGNVTIFVRVIFPNNKDKTRSELIATAFKNNHAVTRIRRVEDILSNPIMYVAFSKDVVQYPLDNLHDINGNISTLYENIARDIFGEDEGICFCTDNRISIGCHLSYDNESSNYI